MFRTDTRRRVMFNGTESSVRHFYFLTSKGRSARLGIRLTQVEYMRCLSYSH